MRTWIYASACLLALSTGGCSCSQRGTAGDDGDGGAGDAARDGVLPDGKLSPDGGPGPRDAAIPWDAGPCAESWYWEREAAPIYRVTLANGAPPRVGVTEQLLVEVQLRSGSCEALGGVDLSLMPGNATDFVELRAYVWSVVGAVGCTPDAPIVSTVVLVPGREQGNTRVVVADMNGTSGAQLLTYQRDYCSGLPDCQCYSGSPPGTGQEHDQCLTDCSCADGLACIGAVDLVGPAWTCLRPCADDRDCGDGERCLKYVADSAAWVCEPGDQCQGDGDCPAGFSCRPRPDGRNECQDLRLAPTMQDCACDAHCPPGQRCSLVWGDAPRCAVWCQDNADCPLEGQGWLVCGTPAVCVPLE